MGWTVIDRRYSARCYGGERLSFDPAFAEDSYGAINGDEWNSERQNSIQPRPSFRSERMGAVPLFRLRDELMWEMWGDQVANGRIENVP